MNININAGKLGFTHRMREELAQQLNEGLCPWWGMEFPEDEDDEDDFFASEFEASLHLRERVSKKQDVDGDEDEDVDNEEYEWELGYIDFPE